MLTREAFLSLDTRPKVRVHLPECNDEIFVRTLSAAQREEWEACLDESNGARAKRTIRAAMVALSACDEQGTPLFTTADIEALSEHGGPVITRIFDAAVALNSISKADVDALEKNSEASPSDSSASA